MTWLFVIICIVIAYLALNSKEVRAGEERSRNAKLLLGYVTDAELEAMRERLKAIRPIEEAREKQQAEEHREWSSRMVQKLKAKHNSERA
jgi:hypothetical protein